MTHTIRVSSIGPIKADARYASSTGNYIIGTDCCIQQKRFDFWMEWFQPRTYALLFKPGLHVAAPIVGVTRSGLTVRGPLLQRK